MIILRSDSEPAILELRKALGKQSEIELVIEEVPVDDHQANLEARSD